VLLCLCLVASDQRSNAQVQGGAVRTASIHSAARATRLRKTISVLVVCVVAVGLALLATDRFILRATPENRHVIYEIRRHLRPGMTLAEVQEISRGESRVPLERYTSDDQRFVTLSVGVGLQSTCDLRLEFAGGHLVRALVRDGDKGRRPDDAPRDLEPEPAPR
jgi:hypothetical protein